MEEFKMEGPPPATAAEAVERIWAELKTVYDPEIPVNIVELGLVYGNEVAPRPEGGWRANVKMTFTAPACPMAPAIQAEVLRKILSLPGINDAHVEIVWDPPWNPSMMSEVARLQLGMI